MTASLNESLNLSKFRVYVKLICEEYYVAFLFYSSWYFLEYWLTVYDFSEETVFESRSALFIMFWMLAVSFKKNVFFFSPVDLLISHKSLFGNNFDGKEQNTIKDIKQHKESIGK